MVIHGYLSPEASIFFFVLSINFSRILYISQYPVLELNIYTYILLLLLESNPLPLLADLPQISIVRRMPQLRQVSYHPPAVRGGAPSAECKYLSELHFGFRHVTNNYDVDSNSCLQHGIPLEITNNLWHLPGPRDRTNVPIL